MKATGIVRRIDELGRVVIPKEIRRTLRIREGDPLEIFLDKEGCVIFKKYSDVGNMSEIATNCAKALTANTGFATIVCDNDVVVAVAGAPRREFFDRSITDALAEQIRSRNDYLVADLYNKKWDHFTPICDPYQPPKPEYIVPIVCEGEAVGAVILLGEENQIINQPEMMATKMMASFISESLCQ